MKHNSFFLLPTFSVLSALAWTRPVYAPAIPAQPTASQAIPMQTQAGPLVTVGVTDAPIRTVLDTLFNGSGKTYVLGTFSADKVTLHIRDASFQTALAALVTAARPPLACEITGDGTYRFKHLSVREAALYSTPPSGPAFDPPSWPDYAEHIYRIPLYHVQAQYVLDTMRESLTGGLQSVDWQSSLLAREINYIMIDKQSNSLLIDATADGYSSFKEIVRNLDQEKAQK